MKKAYFAGGCFWCLSPIFREQKGVFSVISGYSGGNEPNPSYEQVKKGNTGHRETICITYDEFIISFEDLLQIYLWNVDPFDPDGQFIDRGYSYTLAVYYLDHEEESISERKIKLLIDETHKQPFISLEPFKSFYPAEEYHQNYDLKNPELFHKELIESGRLSK